MLHSTKCGSTRSTRTARTKPFQKLSHEKIERIAPPPCPVSLAFAALVPVCSALAMLPLLRYSCSMPAQLDVNREAVRMLAMEIGVRPAARQLNLPESTVKSWSTREGWMEPAPVPATMLQPPASGASKSPAVALQEVLSETNGKSRLSYARNALRVTEHLETEDVPTLLAQAEPAQKWAGIASKAGGWEQTDPRSSGPVLVNLDLRGLTLPEKAKDILLAEPEPEQTSTGQL